MFDDGGVGVAGGTAVRVAGRSATTTVGRRQEEPVCSAATRMAHAVLAEGWEMLHYL